jgi:hypothetical protein
MERHAAGLHSLRERAGGKKTIRPATNKLSALQTEYI